MKKSKFTEAQVVHALKQAEAGVPVEELLRKYGISRATFYAWRKKYGGLGVSEMRRLRELDEETEDADGTIVGLVRRGVRLPGLARRAIIEAGDILVVEAGPDAIDPPRVSTVDDCAATASASSRPASASLREPRSGPGS